MSAFINETDLEFIDISSESHREYNFGADGFVRIKNPEKLNVSDSGGHRLYDAQGNSHYIPSGWISLTWKSKPGKANFVK